MGLHAGSWRSAGVVRGAGRGLDGRTKAGAETRWTMNDDARAARRERICQGTPGCTGRDAV
ncbi:hypothetical protein CERSUDRAFT_113576, partial [Gelatoporia subvermispora B]